MYYIDSMKTWTNVLILQQIIVLVAIDVHLNKRICKQNKDKHIPLSKLAGQPSQ